MMRALCRFLLAWRGDALSEMTTDRDAWRLRCRTVETMAARDKRSAEHEMNVQRARFAGEVAWGERKLAAIAQAEAEIERLRSENDRLRVEATFWLRSAGDASEIILLQQGAARPRPFAPPALLSVSHERPSGVVLPFPDPAA